MNKTTYPYSKLTAPDLSGALSQMFRSAAAEERSIHSLLEAEAKRIVLWSRARENGLPALTVKQLIHSQEAFIRLLDHAVMTQWLKAKKSQDLAALQFRINEWTAEEQQEQENAPPDFIPLVQAILELMEELLALYVCASDEERALLARQLFAMLEALLMLQKGELPRSLSRKAIIRSCLSILSQLAKLRSAAEPLPRRARDRCVQHLELMQNRYLSELPISLRDRHMSKKIEPSKDHSGNHVVSPPVLYTQRKPPKPPL